MSDGQSNPGDFDWSRSELDQLNSNVLYRTLGITIEEARGGVARSLLRANPDICWPSAGQPHGGVVFTQLDTTMATSVMATVPRDTPVSTITLAVNYQSPAIGDVLECRAHCIHQTNRTRFVRGETRNREGLLVATAEGTFRVFVKR
jgi:uncharacterized protein (TIGR00369 family)